MTQIKTLLDEFGVINEANKKLPSDQLRIRLIKALAELEDNECHRTRSFPITHLHKVRGIQQAIYRAYIDKTSGWRLHLQYSNNQIHLKDIVEGRLHDRVIKVIKSKRDRYE